LLSCYAKIRDDAQINSLLESIALSPHSSLIRGANHPSTTAATASAASAGVGIGGVPTGAGTLSLSGGRKSMSSGGKVYLDASVSSELFHADQAINILHTAGFTGECVAVCVWYSFVRDLLLSIVVCYPCSLQWSDLARDMFDDDYDSSPLFCSFYGIYSPGAHGGSPVPPAPSLPGHTGYFHF
jgi:hypothetical protein